VTTTQHAGGAQEHAHLRDVLARQQIIVDVNPEAQQVEIGGNLERRHRPPADQPDHADQHQPLHPCGGVLVDRRRRNGDDDGQDH
jgi:hypothetical protein